MTRPYVSRLAGRVLIGCGVAVLVLALAPKAAAQSNLDTIMDDYRAAAEAARPSMLGIARGTFGVLAVIEIALAAAWWILRERGPADVLSALVVKLGWLGFVFALLSSFTTWFPPIIDGFVAAGQTSTGLPSPNPSAILKSGIDMSAALRDGMEEAMDAWDVLTAGFWFNVGSVMVARYLLLLVYMAIAAVVLLVLVEAQIVLTTGALVLGFAAFRGTASLADRFVAYCFAVGIRLFLLYFLVGVGQLMTPIWLAQIQANPTDESVGLIVLGGSLAYALIVLVLPFKVSSYLTSDFNPGFVRALLSVG